MRRLCDGCKLPAVHLSIYTQHSLYRGDVAVRSQAITMRILSFLCLENATPWMTYIDLADSTARYEPAKVRQSFLVRPSIADDENRFISEMSQSGNTCSSCFCLRQQRKYVVTGAISRECPPDRQLGSRRTLLYPSRQSESITFGTRRAAGPVRSCILFEFLSSSTSI